MNLPCNTVLMVNRKRQIVVTCEQHPTFRVPLTTTPVKTDTPDEVGRAHRENPELFS